MKILLVGPGKWGQKYISTIQDQFPNIQLQIGARESWQQLLADKPSGVIICTPPDSHVSIAQKALQRKIPVMIEKPLSLSHKDASKLLLYQNCAPILVNHIHLFSDYFLEMMKRIGTQNITQISSVVGAHGPFRDYSALLDYGPHDIAMALSIFKEYPHKIVATKVDNILGQIFDIKLHFIGGTADITVSNAFEKKVHHFLVKYDKKTVVYDDGATLGYKLLGMPHNIKHETPPLTNAIKCFTDLIDGKTDPRAGLKLPLQVMRILDECSKQVAQA